MKIKSFNIILIASFMLYTPFGLGRGGGGRGHGGTQARQFKNFNQLTHLITADTDVKILESIITTAREKDNWAYPKPKSGGPAAHLAGHGLGHPELGRYLPKAIPAPETPVEPFDIDKQNYQGNTLLMVVAQWPDRATIEMLLKKFGASTGIKNDLNKTAAQIAREHGHEENAKFIESFGKEKLA